VGLTTILKCDYVKDGKPCGKTFHLPDPPAIPTAGVEFTVSSKDAHGGTLFFCGPLHLVAYWVDFIKSTPKPGEPAPQPAPEPKLIVMPSNKQIQKLQELGIIAADEGNAHKAMEELESIPQDIPVPEDLNLEDA
jgi:hypothetical protein